MKRLVLFTLFLLSLPLTLWSQEPLPAQDVFKVQVKAHDPNTLLLTWEIKPEYFLYQNRIKLSQTNSDYFETVPMKLPKAQKHIDSLGHEVFIYRKALKVPVGVVGTHPGEAVINLCYQGCADNGFCYPPETTGIKLTIDQHLSLVDAKLIKPKRQTSPSVADTRFSGHHWSITLLIFLGLGLLLAFTPCVLPMVPVLSGMLVGHGKDLTTRKAFLLSLSYVLSMALTYAIIGGVIASIGSNLQVLMQSPWIIGLFSFVFFVLALSMFGAYELKLPEAWQSKLARASYKQAQGHHYLGAALMGMLSTLILSPCVTAPLIGALGYIAQTGDVYLGIGALFALGLGMGMPLLLVGASLGKILPHAGAWMDTVKQAFGLILLGVAIYLLARILPAFVTMLLWAGLLIFSGLILGALRKPLNPLQRFLRAAGILMLAYGLFVLFGAALGNTNPLKPLEASIRIDAPTKTVTTLEELDKALAETKSAHKPVMLDFYADWCTACKAIEAKTLKNPDVQAALKQVQMIKVDLSANTPESHVLLGEMNVIAPPTFLFFDKDGNAKENLTLVGEVTASELLQHLEQVQ